MDRELDDTCRQVVDEPHRAGGGTADRVVRCSLDEVEDAIGERPDSGHDVVAELFRRLAPTLRDCVVERLRRATEREAVVLDG